MVVLVDGAFKNNEGLHHSHHSCLALGERFPSQYLPGELLTICTRSSQLWLTSLGPQQVYVNGVSQGHTEGIRVPSYDGVCLTFSLPVHGLMDLDPCSPSRM